MSRRVNMPGADELFRATAKKPGQKGEDDSSPASSGRIKHDEKMTIYLTSEELLAVEQARIALRAELGLKIDRGRFVRAALAGALEEFSEKGSASDFVRRLADS